MVSDNSDKFSSVLDSHTSLGPQKRQIEIRRALPVEVRKAEAVQPQKSVLPNVATHVLEVSIGTDEKIRIGRAAQKRADDIIISEGNPYRTLLSESSAANNTHLKQQAVYYEFLNSQANIVNGIISATTPDNEAVRKNVADRYSRLKLAFVNNDKAQFNAEIRGLQSYVVQPANAGEKKALAAAQLDMINEMVRNDPQIGRINLFKARAEGLSELNVDPLQKDKFGLKESRQFSVYINAQGKLVPPTQEGAIDISTNPFLDAIITAKPNERAEQVAKAMGYTDLNRTSYMVPTQLKNLEFPPEVIDHVRRIYESAKDNYRGTKEEAEATAKSVIGYLQDNGLTKEQFTQIREKLSKDPVITVTKDYKEVQNNPIVVTKAEPALPNVYLSLRDLAAKDHIAISSQRANKKAEFDLLRDSLEKAGYNVNGNSNATEVFAQVGKLQKDLSLTDDNVAGKKTLLALSVLIDPDHQDLSPQDKISKAKSAVIAKFTRLASASEEQPDLHHAAKHLKTLTSLSEPDNTRTNVPSAKPIEEARLK